MKKILLMLGAALCAMSLSVSCTKDGNGTKEPEQVHPMVGTYSLSSYEVAEATYGEGEKPSTFSNYPVSSPLYAVWEAGDPFTFNMQGVFRMMGGNLLPQLLNTVELRADGYVGASYVAEAEPQTDNLMTWAMGTMFSSTYPTASEVTADAATGGFVSTTENDKQVSWSEKDGVVTFKVDINAILGDDAEGIGGIIENVMSMSAAEIKSMLAVLLEDESLNKISDATINQLKGWVMDGIQMTVKEDNGKMNLYLPKSEFDAFMTMRPTGETDNYGDPEMKNDLMIVWDALNKKGLIPEEASMAGLMLNLMGAYWGKTEDFALGLSLVKVN